MDFYNYLILGNSAAAIAAVESIRSIDTTSTIRMVSPEPYAAYGTPLISYLLEGKTTEDQMSLKNESFYDDLSIDTTFGKGFEAINLDPQAHEVKLANGEKIKYDKVLVATGSIPFNPPIAGLKGATNMSTFINLDQAKFCAKQISLCRQRAHEQNRKCRVIIVGAGLIGLKAAESLLSYSDEIVVLEMAPHILPAVLDTEGAAIMMRLLQDHGIVCFPGITANEFIQNDRGKIFEAHLTNDEVLPCDFVVSAVGVRPNASLLEEAGAEMGRGVIIDEALQTSLPDVYAAGDVTQTNDLLDGFPKSLALWPNAIRQGRLAGLHMAKSVEAENYPGNFAVNSVDFFDDIYLLTAGIINPAEGQNFEEVINVEGDIYTKFVIKNNLLYGYITLNTPENAGIYTALINEKIPLTDVDKETFLRNPLDFDIYEPLRWNRLHEGYPNNLNHLGWKE